MRRFDLGDTIVSKEDGVIVLYKVSKVYEGDADYYIKVRRINSLSKNDDERFVVDEKFYALPLRRDVIFEKFIKNGNKR